MTRRSLGVFGLLFLVGGFGKADSLPPWANAPFKYPKKQLVQIDGDALGRCMAVATKEDFAVPLYDKSEMNCVFSRTEFFWYYLPADSGRSCDYSTGREEALKQWVLHQPDNSIDPVKIYRESLKLNRGNVWNAILAIHQLLRRNARWWDARNYNYSSSDAAETLFFNKFIDLRGDLRERGNDADGRSFTGDHPGTWYRIWGIMLHRLSLVSESSWRKNVAVPSCGVGEYVADLATSVTASAAEFLKIIIFEDEDDWRKAEINRAGGRAMGSMIETLFKGNKVGLPSVDACLHPEYWLHPMIEDHRSSLLDRFSD